MNKIKQPPTPLTADAASCWAAAQVLPEPMLESVLRLMERSGAVSAHDQPNLKCELQNLARQGTSPLAC